MISDNLERVIGSPWAWQAVRCFFIGTHDEPDPVDLTFARVPMVGETVIYRESNWSVVAVTWANEGPFITLSAIG